MNRLIINLLANAHRNVNRNFNRKLLELNLIKNTLPEVVLERQPRYYTRQITIWTSE
jgi:hypothetical protein